MTESNNLKYTHNDEPVIEDVFYDGKLVDELYNEIIHCSPPKNIAINGYWGMGKTSLLRQLEKKIGDNNSIVPVWFEAWRYQDSTTPVVALLNEIRSQMGRWASRFESLKKIGNIALRQVFTSFGDAMKVASKGIISPNLTNIPSAGEAWDQSHYYYDLPCDEVLKLLEDAIEKIVDKNGKLVIFIDDLDRCQPEIAYSLLESVKIYLNLKNCVIVFAMDRRQIAESLVRQMRLPEEDKGSALNRASEYIEKICQDSYTLPMATYKQKSSYLIHLVEKLDTGEVHPRDYLERIEKEFDYLPANPRKIKILANRLAFMFRRHGDNKLDDKAFLLLLIVAGLYCFHPAVYEQVAINSAYLNDILDYLPLDKDMEESIGNKDDGVLQIPENDPISNLTFPINIPGKVAGRVNPSDNNVFRLVYLFKKYRRDYNSISEDSLKVLLLQSVN